MALLFACYVATQPDDPALPFTPTSAVSRHNPARLAWMALVCGWLSAPACALPVQDGVAASAAWQVSVSGSTQAVEGGLTQGALMLAPLANSLGTATLAEVEGEAVATGPLATPGAASLSPVRASLVPEAGQWMLMLGGMLMMGVHLRRRLAGLEARPSRY